jgi:hypothetical protein
MYPDREIDRMADRYNDRLLNEHLDKEAAAEIHAEEMSVRFEDALPDAIVAWLNEQGANAPHLQATRHELHAPLLETLSLSG